MDYSEPQQTDDVADTSRFPASDILEQVWETSPVARNKNRVPQDSQQYTPETTTDRRRASISEHSLERDTDLPNHLPADILTSHDDDSYRSKTVLYLAYGSNLASATFLGVRGIKPLSQINVVVPSLRLTFDLPGIPYVEPCFAATQPRRACQNTGHTVVDDNHLNEKASMLENTPLISSWKSHESNTDRALIGVVYEVSLKDYATIIATEGGGSGYKDVVVDCYPFPDTYDPADPVPECPDTSSFKAHTLLSPASQSNVADTSNTKRRRTRPPTRLGYAQPSPRYLNLITTGAAEHDLPISYRTYLSQIQPYRITTFRQRIGKATFLVLWGPPLLLTLGLARLLAGPDGRSPPWLMEWSNFLFAMVWSSYDNVFKKVFGDGERTIDDSKEDLIK